MGVTLVYVIPVIVVLCAFASLAVDWGRVQGAKSDLQRAADAAARFAAKGIANGTALENARSVVAENAVDGTPVLLRDGDVELGQWDPASRQFTAGATPANAVRVTVERSAERGNAVPLMFAPLLGHASSDLRRSSIALAGAGAGLAIVGVDSLQFNGNVRTDSYRSAAGAYGGANAGDTGDIGSNGTVTLNSSQVLGKVHMTAGASLVTSSSTHLGRQGLATPLSIPAPSSGDHATSNDNSLVSPSSVRSGSTFNANGTRVTLPGGNYYFTGFTASSSTIDVTGPTTLYVNGNIDLDGVKINVTSGRAADLTIKVVKATGATVKFNSVTTDSTLCVDLQAPTASVELNSVEPHYFGRLIGKSVLVNSNTFIHADRSLTPVEGAAGSLSEDAKITIVR